MNRRLKVALLLFFFALCGAAMLATRAARGPASPPQTAELYAAVHRQLSAFRAADFQGAYHHSALVVRQRFSLAQFEEMVRHNFTSMTQAGQVEFGAVRVNGTGALAQVFLTAPDGVVHGYLYSFTAERDGWKIDGVQSLGVQPAHRMPGLHV